VLLKLINSKLPAGLIDCFTRHWSVGIYCFC